MKTPFTLLLAVSSCACAAILNFETLPGGLPPVERLIISNQFWNSHGVSFHYTDGTYPIIAKLGGAAPTAFWGPPNSMRADQPATNQNCGSFFLTDGGGVDAPPVPLLIELQQPVASAYGEIIDIFSDMWTVEALNQQTQVIASVVMDNTSPNSGDGKAAPWSFSRPSADIYSLRIINSSTNAAVGWALDNLCLGLPFLPATLRAQHAPQGVEISIGGTFGKNYELQYADSVFATNWQTLKTVLLTNAPTQYVIDSAPTNTPRRFYRAVVSQVLPH